MFGKLFSLLATAALTKQVYGQQPVTLATRDVQLSSILDYRGAVLLVNKKQTSCEAALIDSSAAFIAASCLKYTGTTVDMTKNQYELVIKLGSGNSNSQKVKISKISVHPKYNPSTFTNNVAVVQFNQGSDIAWQEYLAVNPSEWDDSYFSRRSLTNSYSTVWNNIIAFSSTTTPGDCAKASKVYSENEGDFLCSYAASLSVYNRDCKVPYGTVYAVVQPEDSGVAAVYSHSAIYGDSMCSSQKKLHYYTVLRNYIPWAAREIGRSVGGFSRDTSFKLDINYEYAMAEVSSPAVSGVQVFSGDRYSQDPVNPSLADPSPPPVQDTTASASSGQSSVSPPQNTGSGSIKNPQSSDKPSSPASSAGSDDSNGSEGNAGGSNGSAGSSGSSGSNGSAGSKPTSSSTDSPKQSPKPDDSNEDNQDNGGDKEGEGNEGGEGQATVIIDGSSKPDSNSGSSNDNASNSSNANGKPTDTKGNMDIGPSDTEDKEPSSTDEGNSNSGANNADDKEEEKGGPNVAIIGAAAAAAVLAAIGGGWYLWKRNKRNKEIAKENGWGGEGEYKRFTSDSLASAYLPHNDAYGDQDGRRGSEESWRGAGDGRRGDERGSYSSFIQAYSGQNGDSRVQSGAYPAFQNPSTTNLHIDQISGGSHGMGRHGSPTRYNGGYSPGGPSNYQNNSGYSPGGPSNYRNNGNARQYRPDSYNI